MADNGADAQAPLAGCRFWLSGSVPKAFDPSAAERITGFTRLFAKTVFERGGTIVHGSHPSITPLLLDEARLFQERRKKQAPLRLVVSEFFARDSASFGVDVAAWNAICIEPTIVTPAVTVDASGKARARSRSLTLMRRELANQSHFIVAVGGKWWMNASEPDGVPEEIEFARDFMLPLFLLGGLGGATAGYLQQHSEYLSVCRNGLSDETNLQLASTPDIDWIVNTVLQSVAARTEPTDPEAPEIAEADGVGHELASAALNVDRQALSHVFAGSAKNDIHPPFYRILCLDGGGIRGAFTAKTLATWEELTGERIIDHFDLIAGTSTGGILAIGLGMGLSPADMVRFYQDDGPHIFPGGGMSGKLLELKQWLATKFDRKVLQDSLTRAFASAPVKSDQLADSLVRLAITAYDAETDTPRVYRTPHNDFGRLDERRSRLDVALATSAAPTYFDPTQMSYCQELCSRVLNQAAFCSTPSVKILPSRTSTIW